MSTKRYVYKGETYYYSKGRWLDSFRIEVPLEVGKELAWHFSKGRYFTKLDQKNTDNSDKPVKYYVNPSSTEETKRAIPKTPVFSHFMVDKETLVKQEKNVSDPKDTLAKYFGVKSSQYKGISIEELNFPSRIENRLKYYKYDTIDKLLELTWDEVLQIRTFGSKRRKEIEETLRSYFETTSNVEEPKEVQEPIVSNDEDTLNNTTSTPPTIPFHVNQLEGNFSKRGRHREDEIPDGVRRIIAIMAVIIVLLLVIIV